MNRKLLAGVVCIVLAACKPAQPAQPQTNWKDFAQHTVDRYFALNPNDAVYQGDHHFDGKLPDWSDAGLKAHSVDGPPARVSARCRRHARSVVRTPPDPARPPPPTGDDARVRPEVQIGVSCPSALRGP